MRAIDADALRDKLQNLGYDDWNQGVGTTWAEAFKECADMVEDAPTIEPEPNWIPCKERMPEENRTVIASTEYGVYSEARYTKEDGWEWAYEYGADYWVELDEVKAWMPLPEPYKEGEG